uniref:Uncharacterized protein n=1 Tax=Tanacetum cinerariifolium TaxID=118510 RepID=A0A6L2M143_TANCI|nr:hypothetical protein [Tanacetum cinerariifolium]
MTGNISYLSKYEPYDGGYVSFGHGGEKITDFKLKDDTNLLLRTPRQHNMYLIDLNNIVPHKNLTCLVAKASVDESMLWHRRLGHLNFKTMNKLVRNNLVKGLPSKCFKNDHTCVASLKGKQHKASCKTKLVNSVSKPLHTLHMDLFGPTSISSLNHKWYCLVVTDDFSRFTWTLFLRTKDETTSILRNFITEIENLKDLKVKIIRVAERRNKTLIEAARTMLADAKLPVTFWTKAVNTACYVQNRVLVNKSQNKTPYELFNGITPTIGFLRPFGCHVMILNTLDHLGKFDAKGDEVVVAGTSSTNISSTKEVASQAVKKDVDSDAPDDCNSDVPKSSGIPYPTASSKVPTADQIEHVVSITVESKIPSVSSPVPTICLDISPRSLSGPRLITEGDFSQKETPSLGNALNLSNRFEDTFGMEANLSNMETNIPVSPTPTFRIHKDHPKSQIIGPIDTSVHTRHKSKEMEEQSFIASIHQKTNLDLLQFYLFSCFLSQEEPKKIFDALKDPSWVEAMQEELLQVKIKNVWVLVDYLKEVRHIGTKWVLKNKKDERGIVFRNKARLVTQGYTQEEGIDYEEILAPVARIEAIRLFLAYASFIGFIVYQMDVKSAFLYGTIDEEVYVMQPPGFQDPEFPDRTLFIRKHKGEFLLVQVYVDDIIFGLLNPQLCREFEALTHAKFQMSAMGELTFFLGLQVLQKKDVIFLSQDKYVGDILKKFGYSDVRSANTPMDKENPWRKDGPGKDVELYLYRSMIRSLMYLTASRLDIMFVVYACARHQVTPKECHLYAIKRIFRYLKGHPKLGLWYPKESPFDLVAYSDSDYGGATQDRKSTTGEKTEQNTDFHQIVDFLEAFHIRRHPKLNDEEGISSLPNAKLFENLSLMGYNILPNLRFTFQKGQFSHQWKFLIHTIMQCLSPKSTGFNEFSSNITTTVVCLATNRVYNFSKMIFDGMGEGSANLTEPHHTPLPQEQHSPHHVSPSLPHPTTTSESILQAPTEPLTHRQYTRRAIQVAQSKALSHVVDEPASLSRDDRQGEGFPTVSSLDAGHDRENIAKTSTLPHESSPRVTSLDADEGSMQQRIHELMELCTSLQRQKSQMAAKIKDQEISELKPRVKFLEDKESRSAEHTLEDAPITGGIMEIGEELGADKSTKLWKNDTEEMVNVLSLMEAINILTSGGAADSVSPTDVLPTAGVPTVSGSFPTVSAIFTTTTMVTPYTRRPRGITIGSSQPIRSLIFGAKDKGKEKVVESEVPKKRKLQEQIDAQVSREMEEEFARENQRVSEQLARDSKIARLHAEEELKIMIEGLNRNNEVKHPIIDWEMHSEGKREEDLHQLWTLVKETFSIKQATKDKGKELWVELKRLFELDFEDQLWTHNQAFMYDPLD